jgi:hypothetical protein
MEICKHGAYILSYMKGVGSILRACNIMVAMLQDLFIIRELILGLKFLYITPLSFY